jgi:hypothetical protein
MDHIPLVGYNWVLDLDQTSQQGPCLSSHGGQSYQMSTREQPAS